MLFVFSAKIHCYSVADPGEEPRGQPPLFLDQTEARRAEKVFLGGGPGPPLSMCLDDQPPLPPSQGRDPALLVILLISSAVKRGPRDRTNVMVQSFCHFCWCTHHGTFYVKNSNGACSFIILATQRICFVACFVLMTVRI